MKNSNDDNNNFLKSRQDKTRKKMVMKCQKTWQWNPTVPQFCHYLLTEHLMMEGNAQLTESQNGPGWKRAQVGHLVQPP